ncbi:MAG: NAD(P)-binding protein [Myxococcales bacterium]|nr:NAD(P)-binding protein [Myxococcales bacterium]
MRSIAVIGSGIAGLVTAHGLRRAGCAVTLWSDRTPDQWLAARPTGTAARFAPALAYERELGLDHWHDQAPPIEGAHLLYCPRPGLRLVESIGRQSSPGLAIDVRLQSHRWMHELEARGGRVEIESVTVDRLDQIAAAHDLTIVATGGGGLDGIFERDPVRSVHHEPQRTVAMVVVTGPALRRPQRPVVGVDFTILEGIGETAWIPYFHRDAGPCWNLIFEAKAGGPMDVFGSARSGAEALAAARRTIEALLPWDAAWARDMALADAQGWLVGRITPTVRSPVGRLPSGRVVTCVGDTAVRFDPLAAQGANNCTKMAKHLVARVVARGEQPLDAAWMTQTFDDFWAELGHPAYALTNLLLAPMTRPGRLVLLAQAFCDGTGQGSRQALADAFAEGFAEPRRLVEAFCDGSKARRLVTETTGRWWPRAVAAGAMGVARSGLRRALGRPG